MNISRASWVRYVTALRRINEQAGNSVSEYFDRYGFPQTQEQIDTFIGAAYGISTKYGEAAAELAAEMYDAMATMQGAIVPPAEPAPTATISETAEAVQGTLKSMNMDIVRSAVARLVKLAGVDTTLLNAERDGAEWAWVPNGETCAFCITLASNGWQQASKAAVKGGHAKHIHANCDCTYAIRFDGKTKVQGYDPERYRDMYYGADLDGEKPTANNRVNALRREIYAENRDRINEQKRNAYAKHKALNASTAEEIKVD